jgi:D-alanyl-D-alanine carboxypeptidase/D-alanyl-D-alanine-endopeptidase (penicillin-binding protein 4)
VRRTPALIILALLAPAAAPTGAAASASAPASAATVGATLARGMSAAGSASGALAFDVSTGRTVYARRADIRRIPASVEKLSTTATILTRMGAAAVLQTAVLGDGVLEEDGTYRGTLYLRGAGDPTFGSSRFTTRAYGTGATVSDLVKRLVERTGIERVRGRVVGDESFFDSLRGGPDAGYGRSYDLGGPLTGLVYNRGLTDNGSFQRRPALYAAARLTDELRRQGIKVSGAPGEGRAGDDAEPLASVDSPRLATLLRLTNRPSDNFFAETLLKNLGARFGGAGSTAAGARVVRSQLATWGSFASVMDGSGLSRRNRTSPREVVGLLRGMLTGSNVAAWRDSLAVAGRSGTLAGRMNGTAAQGRCQGKTGTLSDVSALAGYCRTANGHTIAFAFLMNRVDVSSARAVQNGMAAALAASRPAGAIRTPAPPPAPTPTPATQPSPIAPPSGGVRAG